jgi:hypothetical protein
VAATASGILPAVISGEPLMKILSVVAVTLVLAQAQQPPQNPPAQGAPAQGAQPPQGGAGGRGGFNMRAAAPVPYDDYTGFTKIWDGETFKNWDGESDVWSIEDGMLHADTVKTPGQHHIHYIGPNAVMKDFDLKVEFKISAEGANGGIQYRSRLLHAMHGGSIADPMGKPTPPGITTMAQAVSAGLAVNPPQRQGGPGRGRGGDASAPGAVQPQQPPPPPRERAANEGNPWQVSGYQFDIDSANRFTGQLYEGQGRGIQTAPGAIVQMLPERKSQQIGTVSDAPAAIVKPHKGKDGDWQQVEIIARGNTLVHILNGKVISVTIDDNPDMRALQGILSLQLEGSGQIWYRNVYLKVLP